MDVLDVELEVLDVELVDVGTFLLLPSMSSLLDDDPFANLTTSRQTWHRSRVPLAVSRVPLAVSRVPLAVSRVPLAVSRVPLPASCKRRFLASRLFLPSTSFLASTSFSPKRCVFLLVFSLILLTLPAP